MDLGPENTTLLAQVLQGAGSASGKYSSRIFLGTDSHPLTFQVDFQPSYQDLHVSEHASPQRSQGGCCRK